MGQLSDPTLSANSNYQEIKTECTTDTWNNEATIKVHLTYEDWTLSDFNLPSFVTD